MTKYIKVSSTSFLYWQAWIITFAITYLSYYFEEKFYFLIPFIILPYYQIFYFYFFTIIQFMAKSKTFKNIDISKWNFLTQNLMSMEIGVSLTLLYAIYSEGKVFKFTVIWLIYEICVLLFLTIYLKLTFASEAKKQNIAVDSLSVFKLISEIYLESKKCN